MFALKKRNVSKNPLHITQVYNVGKVIGQGNLGDVRYCQNKVTKEKAAVKIFSKQFITKQNIGRVYYEIELMKTFDHPNIVKIFDWFEDEDRIYMVMEWM